MPTVPPDCPRCTITESQALPTKPAKDYPLVPLNDIGLWKCSRCGVKYRVSDTGVITSELPT